MSKIVQRSKFNYGENNEFLGWQPATVECCGEEIVCHGFTNTCDKCGADFDSNGSRLAPREQWGEETGEHYTDIVNMRAPYDDNY